MNNAKNRKFHGNVDRKDLPKIVLDLSVDKDLLDKTAEVWAEAIGRTKKTQARNFYDKVLELKARMEKEPFENVYPFIKMLNSKVTYAHNRRVASLEFKQMMQECLRQITPDEKGKRKFEVFKLFFEAILGFFKGAN